MESSISVALAGQVALRRRLDLVAHNLANADTAGFRLEGQVVQIMPRRDSGATVVYPIDRGSYTDFRAAPIRHTGNQLDVALVGQGFLAVETAGGPRYTRDGRLNRGADGTLVDLDGRALLADGGGTIVLPEEAADVAVAADGTVTADGAEIGRLAIFRLPSHASWTRGADGLFESDAAEPAPDLLLQSGALEGSNVQPVREIVAMMELQRGYGRIQLVLDGEDERIRKLVDRAVRG